MTEQKSPNLWYKKWWAIALFIYFGLVIIGSFNDENKPTNPSKTPTQQQKAKKEQEKPATIPGISAVDIYGNMKKIGFSCTGPEVGSDGLAFWECKEETSEHLYLVEILGNTPSEILTVQATALNYSNKATDNVAKDFFGYVASVPYDNSDPVTAKNWIMQNISRKTNKAINGVRFTIVGNKRSRMLTIAHENSDLD